MTAAQEIDSELQAVCSEDPGIICEAVWNRTGNELLTNLAEWAAEKPLKITLILFFALILNRLVRRLIRHFIDELTDDVPHAMTKNLAKVKSMTPRALKATGGEQSLRSTARAQTIGLVLKSSASVIIWSLAILMALSEVGINLAPLIAGAGIVGVALGFGAQSLVKDFLSGIFMLAEDQYGVGDVIDAGPASGVVEAVNLRTTRLRDIEGTVWHIPNGEITRVGNMSQQWARALIDVDVAYDTNLELAQREILEVATALRDEDAWRNIIIEDPEVLGVQNLGADGIQIRLIMKTQPGEQWPVMREVRRRLKDRFDEIGIEIPFPQRTLWVKRDAGTSKDDPFDPDGDDGGSTAPAGGNEAGG